MSCGCKGIRSCYSCDPNLKKQTNLNEKCFVYSDSLKMAISKLWNEETKQYCLCGFKFPGVILQKNFINEEDQSFLISQFDNETWKQSQSGRNKQDFGPKVNFKKQKVNYKKFSGLPMYSEKIVQRLQCIKALSDFKPVEMCNLDYNPSKGAGIDPHFDDSWLWGERLVTVNMLTNTWYTMSIPKNKSCSEIFECIKFLESDEVEMLEKDITQQLVCIKIEEKNTDRIVVRIPLLSGSLIVLKEEARHKWMHEIRRQDIIDRRVCSTFRELSSDFINGQYKELGNTLLQIASSYCGTVVL